MCSQTDCPVDLLLAELIKLAYGLERHDGLGVGHELFEVRFGHLLLALHLHFHSDYNIF